MVAFAASFGGSHMGLFYGNTLAVCYISICPLGIFHSLQTITKNALGLFGAPNSPDGSFGGYYWNVYDLHYLRRTINPGTGNIGSPASVLMAQSYSMDTEFAMDINPGPALNSRIQNLDDYANATTVALNMPSTFNFVFSYSFFDYRSGQRRFIENRSDIKNFDVLSVWELPNYEKILFRSQNENNGSYKGDLYFEHTRTGLFSQSPSAVSPLAILNDNKIQNFPFAKYSVHRGLHEIGFFSQEGGLGRSFRLYDFNTQTIAVSRARTWGENQPGVRAIEYHDGFIYGTVESVDPITQAISTALKSEDCR